MRDFIKNIDPKIKILSVIGLSLIIYGKLVKIFSIYFFWESSELGLFIFIFSFGLTALVEILIKFRILSSYYKSGWKTLFYGAFTILLLVVYGSLYLSDSLKIAEEKITEQSEIIDSVGEIEGFWLQGGASSTVNSGYGESVYANYQILVKGADAFKEVTAIVQKSNDGPWDIEIITTR